MPGRRWRVCSCSRWQPPCSSRRRRSQTSCNATARAGAALSLPCRRYRSAALVSPPVALTLDVFAGSLAEVGRADDDDLEALRAGLVATPRTGRDPHRVPFLELDDLVVELHPPAPAQDHVDLLLLPVRVAVRKAIAGRYALVAQSGSLELERPGRQAELEIGRAVEPGPDVLQVFLEVPERERHGRNRMVPWLGFAVCASTEVLRDG